MTSMLRAIIVDSEPGSRAALRRTLAATPSMAIVGEVATIAEAVQDAPARDPDVLIVEVPGDDRGGEKAPGAIANLSRLLPNAAIFATGPGSVSADFVIRVIRAGALEFLRRPVERADLQAALEKVVRFRRGAAPARRVGRITAAFSAKGGLGVTTLALFTPGLAPRGTVALTWLALVIGVVTRAFG